VLRLLDEQQRDLADCHRFRGMARHHQDQRDELAEVLLDYAKGLQDGGRRAKDALGLKSPG